MSRHTIAVIIITFLMVLAGAWYHDAFGQDTVLVDDKQYTVKLSKNKYMHVSGDRRVYKKNGTFRRGTWKSIAEKSGIYEHKIQEKLTTRSSENAPTYKISNANGDYISFIFEGGTVPADSFKFRVNKDGWIWKNNDGKYTVEIQISEGKSKETIISRQETSFKWLLDANNQFKPRANGGIATGPFVISPPVTVDKFGDTLNTTADLDWNNGWWYTLSVDEINPQFPITIDPTVIDTTITYTQDGYWQPVILGNFSGRDSARVTSGTISNANIFVGLSFSIGTYGIYRGYLSFNYNIPVNAIWDSAVTILDGNTDYSDTDFDIIFVSSFAQGVKKGAADSSRWSYFHGWGASGAYTGIMPLNKGWNSSLYSAGYDNRIAFNSYGLDTLKAHNGLTDSIQIHMISDEDSASSTPINAETIVFDASAGGNDPLLIIYYHLPVILSCSLSVGSTPESIRVHVYGSDTSMVDSTRIFKITGSDTLPMTGFSTNYQLNWIDSCHANTRYILFPRVYYNGAEKDSVRGILDTIYTRPDTVTMLLTQASATGIYINPAVGDSNTANTKISIMDSAMARSVSHRVWFNINGDTSATERFFTDATWGTFLNSGKTRGQWGIYALRGQNDDSTYKSALTVDSLQIAILYDSTRFTALDTNRVEVMFDADSFAYGHYIKWFAYDYDVTADTTWGDSILATTSQHKDTITLPDSLNKKYYGKVVLTDSGGTRHYSDPADSFRTWSWQPTATGNWTSDTSFYLTITGYAGNQTANTGHYVIDSARVAAGSTAVYLDPDSIGYIPARSIRSTTALSDTFKVYRNSYTAGVTPVDIKVHSVNLDTLGNE
uniref:Uncharacterized protein n=4 Tax=viral metagenome TaxID=1070528 RepID=A0A6M3XC38_9ZZZZ